MAAPQAQSWKDLPTACLHEIFSRVPCTEDRHSAYRACSAWLRALGDLPPTQAPPALPWLLVPAPNPNGSTRLVCILSGCCVHQDHHYAAVIPRGARCFGSHDGAWLFLATHDDGPRGHQLLNVRTGAILQLPGDMEMVLGLSLDSLGLPMTIHAAALSAAPDDESCVAVSIVTPNGPDPVRSIARWRMGQQRAFEILPPGLNPLNSFLDAEDVVYHDGAFYLLLRDSDRIAVYTPEVLPDWQIRFFSHPGASASNYGDDQGRVRARYLVSSRGQLLLVVRFAPHPNERTSNFMVFLATESPDQMPDDEAYPIFPDNYAAYGYPWTWSVLGPLTDRILFVGHGFSRSYEVHEYEAYKFKAGIYFLDDGMFFVEEPEMYPCSDNGWWSDSDGTVHHCFTEGDPSCNSPPAWLLP